MANKLIYKITSVYLIISLSVFLVSLPLFYIAIEGLWIEDVDDSLRYQREKIVSGIESNDISDEEIGRYVNFGQLIDDGIVIESIESITEESDSIYYQSAFDATRGHVEPFRELLSYRYINGKPYKIVLKRDLVESEDLILGIFVVELVIFSILIGLIVFISLRYLHKIWNPFYRIINQLNLFNLHEKSSLDDVNCKGIYEFEDLKSSVNELIYRNYAVFKSQKEFAENAAHEMQTPLAIINSQLGILANTDIDETQFSHLQSIDRSVKHQSILVKGLLMLSKLENRQFILDDRVDVKAVVDDCYNLMCEELTMCGVPISIDIEKDVVLDRSNLMLFTTLVNGLLNNAIKHGATPNAITISLDKERLQISNLGVGRSLDVNKIFNRFYKEETDSKGTGLGLSIAFQICEVLNYKIDYSFSKENNHSFSIVFS